jgi:hypothetical protein
VGKNSDFVQRIQPGSTTLDWLARRLKESTAYKLAVAAEKTWLSFQLKVLYIAGPLVSTNLHQLAKKVRLMDMEEVSENVKVASELTATVSYNISRRRRQNILNHTDLDMTTC